MSDKLTRIARNSTIISGVLSFYPSHTEFNERKVAMFEIFIEL